jgi:hypothetical protein
MKGISVIRAFTTIKADFQSDFGHQQLKIDFNKLSDAMDQYMSFDCICCCSFNITSHYEGDQNEIIHVSPGPIVIVVHGNFYEHLYTTSSLYTAPIASVDVAPMSADGKIGVEPLVEERRHCRSQDWSREQAQLHHIRCWQIAFKSAHIARKRGV